MRISMMNWLSALKEPFGKTAMILFAAGMIWASIRASVNEIPAMKEKILQHDVAVAVMQADLRSIKDSLNRIEGALGSR